MMKYKSSMFASRDVCIYFGKNTWRHLRWWFYLCKVFTRHLNVECFESAVPAIFFSYAPTFLKFILTGHIDKLNLIGPPSPQIMFGQSTRKLKGEKLVSKRVFKNPCFKQRIVFCKTFWRNKIRIWQNDIYKLIKQQVLKQYPMLWVIFRKIRYQCDRFDKGIEIIMQLTYVRNYVTRMWQISAVF